MYVDVPCATRYIPAYVVSGTTIVSVNYTLCESALIFECCESYSHPLASLTHLPRRSFDFCYSNYEKAQGLTSYDETMKKKIKREGEIKVSKILVFSELSSNRPRTDGIKIERTWPGLISVNDTTKRGRR